jgi:hypothetical protein
VRECWLEVNPDEDVEFWRGLECPAFGVFLGPPFLGSRSRVTAGKAVKARGCGRLALP